MEQLPHWLMVTVFAAGMTAYADEVDPESQRPAPPAGLTAGEAPLQTFH